MHRQRLGMLAALIAGLAAVMVVFVASATARGLERPRNTNTPTISGTPQEGATLTASPGGWFCEPGPCTFSYQWQRCNANGVDCGPIPGATGQTYVPTPADVGYRMQVAVTGSNIDCDMTGGVCAPSSGSAVSTLTGIVTIKPGVAPAATGPPVISGTPMDGERLTATQGSFSGEQPLRMGIEWVRCDRAGESCSSIRGANTNTYVAGSADVGNTLRVYVTASNRGGSASAVSAPTPVIRPVGPTPERRSVSVADVAAPHRLVIDGVQAPRVVRSAAPFTVRVHVVDTRGFWISGAVVSAMAVPPDLARSREARTAASGWASVVLRPTAAFSLRAGRTLYLYVQTRKPGETALSSTSGSRLVRVAVRLR